MPGPVVIRKRKAAKLYSEAATVRTVDGDTGDLTFPAGESELFVGLNITAASGTSPTLDVSVEQQDANGVYHAVDSFPQKTAAGADSLHIRDKVIVGGGTFRVAWVIGGTSPSFTFQVGISSR